MQEFETWEDVPSGVMVEGRNGLYINLAGSGVAFTSDRDSLDGFSGGWILSTHTPIGPFNMVTVSR